MAHTSKASTQHLKNPRSGLTHTEKKTSSGPFFDGEKFFSSTEVFRCTGEASKWYEPHKKLSVILKQQYQNVEQNVFDQMSQETLAGTNTTGHSTITDSFQQSTVTADHTITASVSSSYA